VAVSRSSCGAAGPQDDISVRQISGYPPEGEAEIAKTLIDIDEESLAAAARALHTETKKDTVNAALAARRRDLQRLTSGGLPDLEDEQVMRAASLR